MTFCCFPRYAASLLCLSQYHDVFSVLCTQIEAGHFSLVPQLVDLPNFLGVLADTLQLQAQAKGLTFMADYAPDLPRRVRLDGDRLRQVLVNVCDNAFKFTPPGMSFPF